MTDVITTSGVKYYYDLSIRDLDLALRDAKAVLAQAVRRREEPNGTLANAVELVHETYCHHLLDLIELAEAGTIEDRSAEVIAEFLVRVHRMNELLRLILQSNVAQSSPVLREHQELPWTLGASA